ncbi:MAG: hypothetical protein QOF61_2012 [Acidobacteriota bacterium]|nr:hypothetical protein [Acidobacteriota bacterium]
MRYKVPHSFRDADVSALAPALVEQIKVSVLLGYGFALSLVSLGGVGALVAFVIGWRARSRIKRSRGQLVGLRLAWWCIIVGGLETITTPLAIISEIFHWK